MSNGEILKEYGKYVMNNFEFENGEILEDVVVEYSLLGRPEYDEKGNIINAVVFSHGFNGDYSFSSNFQEFANKVNGLEGENYFFILITSLGFPDSCSPSSTGLNHKFPNYSMLDKVNFKRQFLKEYLNIEKVHGISGWGSGGYEVLTWAATFPDEMDFIILLSTAHKTNGYRYVISKCIDSLIESSDDFYSDVYSESLSRIMVSINQLLYSNYFSKQTFQNMSNDEIDVLMDDFVDAGLFVDIYDFKYRNDAVLEYDVEDKLKNIKAKTMIISSDANIYYFSEFDAIPMSEQIENSTLVFFDSKRDYHDIEDYSVLYDDFKKFLEEFKK